MSKQRIGPFRVQRSINNGARPGDWEGSFHRRLEGDARTLAHMQQFEADILGPPVPEAPEPASPPTPEQQPEPSKV